jgi:hypothetical protein
MFSQEDIDKAKTKFVSAETGDTPTGWKKQTELEFKVSTAASRAKQRALQGFRKK